MPTSGLLLAPATTAPTKRRSQRECREGTRKRGQSARKPAQQRRRLHALMVVPLLPAVPALRHLEEHNSRPSNRGLGGRHRPARGVVRSGVDELRDEGLDGSGIKVCIVDTGIDPDHPDFKDMNLVGFRDFYSFDHGTVRDVSQSNHGTAMAGLLVAKGSGPMRGMAPNVELSVAVGLGPEGTTGNSARVADAIQWCRISQQVNIISLSLGGPFEATSQIASRSVAGAVEDALDAGIFVVAAAGNAGPDNTDVSTPANVDRVISVGAYDRFMTPWSNSSVGSQVDPYSETTRTWPNQKPEILGPGSYILSTVSSDKSPPYAYSTGTSDATLFVTGSLALILQDLSQRDVVNISSSNDNRIDIVKRALAESARPMGGQIGHDARSGYGMLDAVEWRDRVESTANQW